MADNKAADNKTPLALQPVSRPEILRGLLEKGKASWGDVAKKYLTPERLFRVALLAFARQPDLYRCSQISVLGALMDAARWELEIGGPDGDGFLVPFENRKNGTVECTFIPGYQGLCKTLIRQGAVDDIMPHAVYEKDEFELFFDNTGPNFRHRPYGIRANEKGTRGALVGIYSLAFLPSGRPSIHWMNIAEIEEHKERFSKNWKSSKSGWQTNPLAMQKKTVIRQHYKFLPKAKATPELVERMDTDEPEDIEINAQALIEGAGISAGAIGGPDKPEDQGKGGNPPPPEQGAASNGNGGDAGPDPEPPSDDLGGDEKPEDRVITREEQTALAELVKARGLDRTKAWSMAKAIQPDMAAWRDLKLSTYDTLTGQIKEATAQ